MGNRVGRGTKRRREQAKRERIEREARMAEIRERNRRADEAAVAARKEAAERHRAALEVTAKLVERLGALGYEIKPLSHWPSCFYIKDDVLEKLIAALEEGPAVGSAG